MVFMSEKIGKLNTICYLSPVFTPAIGGGVEYLELLSRYLLAEGACDKFIIVTEAFPGAPKSELRSGGRLQILRKYPFRAGRDVKNFSSYLLYFWQNLKFIGLPFLLGRLSIDVLMVHGSFLNNPSSLWFVLRLFRYFSPNMRIIADLRDPKLPLRKISSLKLFDVIISCSENITNRLSGDPDVFLKVREIPIIVEVSPPSRNDLDIIKKRYSVGTCLYVFNGSGLKKEKGVDRLIDLVAKIRQKGYNINLVIVGKRRYWGKRLEQATQEGWFHYLGQIDHYESMALAAGSWLDVNLSGVDSMPRHSLEALLSGAKVLLPEGVPEFEKECPDCIAFEKSIEDLANKAIRIANGELCSCRYDVKRHQPMSVIDGYMNVLEEIA